MATTLTAFTFISICVSNFRQNTGIVFPIIIVPYVLTAGDFDFYLKNFAFGIFETSDFYTYLFVTGAYICILTILLTFVIKKIRVGSSLVRMFSPDAFGVTCFV
mmetsp:Transcript_21478/g.19051  ORF Transcript_21478/g.19051 Transcript_21478/m.19051 type:complete len:104 (+) Transcript_21478:408-719(+)